MRRTTCDGQQMELVVMTFSRVGLRGAALALAMVGSALATGACSRSRDVYDPVDDARRPWSSREERAYRRWEVERNMRHVAYQQRQAEQQREYWEWRRSRPGEDRERRGDRDHH